MAVGLQWVKLTLDATARSIIDRAIGDLSRREGSKLVLIRKRQGKIMGCRAEDLWFCHVRDENFPPRTLAIDVRPEQRTLLPAEVPADFDECCDLLGFRTEADRNQFHEFLRLDPDRVAPSPDPGAP